MKNLDEAKWRFNKMLNNTRQVQMIHTQTDNKRIANGQQLLLFEPQILEEEE